jgi:hypothetical protein
MMFSVAFSPGRRWKMFLPGAGSTHGEALSTIAASALIRSRWSSVRGRCNLSAASPQVVGRQEFDHDFRP